MKKTLLKSVLSLVLLVSALPLRAADWVWDTSVLYSRQHTTPSNYNFTTDWVPGPDGTGQSLKITEPSINEWNHFLVVPRSYLNANITQFKAVIKFRVVTPTVLPCYFYMFARCSGASGVEDQWQKFVAESVDGQRTIEFPIDFKPAPGGTWSFYFGVNRTGTIIIDSLVIKEGWGLSSQPAQLNVTPVSTIPPGVTAATGAPATITIDPPAAGTVTTLNVNNLVADAGGVPVSSAIAAQNSSRLQTWLNTARTTTGTKKILIPLGTYRFEAPNANGLLIDNTNDLTFDAQGSTFIFQKLFTGQHFTLTNSNRLIIKNLNVDWNWDYKPIASLAKVIAISADKKTITFEFPTLTTAQTLLTRQSLWYTLMPMDPATLRRNGSQFYSLGFNNINTPSSLVASGNQIVGTFPNALPLELNRSYAVKHLYYELGAFKLGAVTHTLFDNVKIYSAPGVAWLNTEASHHLKWNNCQINRATGSTYPLVTGADGIHSGESQGDIVIQNTLFTGLGDDAINLHDNCWQGGLYYVAGQPKQLRLTNCPNQRLRMKAGDTIEFSKADYSPSGVTLTLASDPTFTFPAGGNSNSNTATATVTFTTNVPANVSHFSILNNSRFNTKNVRIIGNQFLYLNGRAVLLSADNATVQNCYFRNVSSTSLQLTTEIVNTAFMEGRGAFNVVVKGNTFENTNHSGSRWDLATIYAGALLPWGPADYPLFNTMLFDDNQFYNTPGPAISVCSGYNVIAKDNLIQYTQVMPNATPNAGVLQAVLSNDMALGGNTWYNWSVPTFKTGVLTDPATTDNIETLTNRRQ